MQSTQIHRQPTLGAALIAILPVAIAAVAGSLVTTPNISGWYVHLVKPSFTPPNAVFGPVWTLLYIAMAYAFFRILRLPTAERWPAPVVGFLVQIALNGLWSFAFFGTHSPAAGLAVIVPLWASIALTLVLFWRLDRVAGALLLPYLVWVSYASALNFAIWQLNP
jgi:tryptophan-rich sensory protein